MQVRARRVFRFASQVKADGIRAIDLGRSFGVEQFVIAYKASTVKLPAIRDLLEWLTR